MLDGQVGIPIGDELVDRVVNNPASQLLRRVVDAQPLAFGRLGHLGKLARLLGVATKQARLLELLEFGDRAFEQMAEDVEIHFVGKTVAADSFEEDGLLVGQFDIIHRVRREETAVVTWDVGRLISLVDKAKQAFETLPARIGDRRKTGHCISFGDGFFGQQAAVFAKGDEHDAVNQPLRHFDRQIERMIELFKKML